LLGKDLEGNAPPLFVRSQ